MTLPTQQDFCIHNSPDELAAAEHFSGRSLSEAENIFGQNPLYYQEDLMWMGPVAFRFYVQAAIRYIQNNAATGDMDIINNFADILEFRLENESQELQPIAMQLATICKYICEHWDKFDFNTTIQKRYAKLKQTFEEII